MRHLLLAALLLAGCAGPSRPGRGPDPALNAASAMAEVAASLGPGCRAGGSAVHLGQGRFITAAHIVDGLTARAQGCRLATSPSFMIAVAGSPAPATLRTKGLGRMEAPVGLRYAGGQDLALLTPDRPLPGLAAATPCASDARPGQEVVLVTRRRAERLRLVAIAPEPDPAFGAYAELPLAMVEGESGGGAFDAVTGCLAGLVSHREDADGGPRTRLVQASAIRRFLSM